MSNAPVIMSGYGRPPPYIPRSQAQYYSEQQQPSPGYVPPYPQQSQLQYPPTYMHPQLPPSPGFPQQPPQHLPLPQRGYYPSHEDMGYSSHGTYTSAAAPDARGMEFRVYPQPPSYDYRTSSANAPPNAPTTHSRIGQAGSYPQQHGGMEMRPPPQRNLDAARAAAHETFRRFDSNNNGYLDLQEFLDALRALHLDISYHGALECFASSDTNEDGRIGRNEFESVYIQKLG